jgi:hypothetical protein
VRLCSEGWSDTGRRGKRVLRAGRSKQATSNAEVMAPADRQPTSELCRSLSRHFSKAAYYGLSSPPRWGRFYDWAMVGLTLGLLRVSFIAAKSTSAATAASAASVSYIGAITTSTGRCRSMCRSSGTARSRWAKPSRRGCGNSPSFSHTQATVARARPDPQEVDYLR